VALIAAAARLLAEEGSQALSTRRLAAETGSSTMAVYTYFGGMSGLVREIVHEGFRRLNNYFTRLDWTDDPVADMALLGRLYRHSARANPHLYAAMFGGAALGGFSLTEQDRQYGRYTLVNVVECAHRCMAATRFRPADPDLVAHQMWITMHGLVNLEMGDYLIEPYDAECCFETLLVSLMVSVGDTLAAATDSVAASRVRFHHAIEADIDTTPPVRDSTGHLS
jgi:AcrR family transcriptional regulator